MSRVQESIDSLEGAKEFLGLLDIHEQELLLEALLNTLASDTIQTVARKAGFVTEEV